MNDSLRKKLADSLGLAYDSSYYQPVDSTARIKYFQYKPKYSFGTKLKEKTHPLLLDNSTRIQREVTFNDKNQVVIRQTFNGEEIRAPLVMDFKDYLKILEKTNDDKVFYDLFSDRFKGSTTDDLTKLFEKFTDITIPLPFKSETIFGPPTFNLRINGTIDITASFQNITSDESSVSFISNNQNNINFKQEVQVTAKGSIGDKLTIDADWNTQRVFDFENQLHLKYTGYADEVIQKIEAGNVSLDTKSSLIQSTQALFGIKGEFKLGPLTLSTVVSQKKSKTEEKTYSSGTQDQNFQIPVYDYSDSHYFIDTLYKHSFLDTYNDSTGGGFIQTDYVRQNRIDLASGSFEVWVQCDNTYPKKRLAVGQLLLGKRVPNGYDTLLHNPTSIQGERYFGYYRKLEPDEYFVDDYAGFVSLKVSAQNLHVAVAYRLLRNADTAFGKGENMSLPTDTLVLKLIKADVESPIVAPLAWQLKMKNIYRLPVSKILEDGFNFDVVYVGNSNTATSYLPNNISPKPLIQIVKLDRYTSGTLSPPPDGKFDFRPGKTINKETGDIIFPTLQPFADEIRLAGADTTIQYPEIYTQTKVTAQTSQKASYFFLKGSAKGESGISNTFNLGLNIVSGSVKVWLGQNALQENIDYSVDYVTGVVVIRNASALTAKDLRITYESNDLFSLASKTFIGLRGDYKINEKTSLGFTFVNLKQETLNDKVRIGEEPTNNSMFGMDFTTELKPNFITKALNYLPGFNSKEESILSLRGEVAYLTPDPNTRKSLIPQDNGEAIAYIDDMEGAKKIVSLGTSYASWTISSLPIDSAYQYGDSLLKQDNRGKMIWYNNPNTVKVKDVYPLRDVQAGQDLMTPFDIYFDPSQRGTYNYNWKNYDTTNKYKNWNGIMKYLNTTSNDLISENINFIEFNMRVDNQTGLPLTNAKFYIDLGIISEDAIPDGQTNTEDFLSNGIIQDIYDLGLDFKNDQQELDTFNIVNGTQAIFPTLDDYEAVFHNRDPAGDNNNNHSGTNIDFSTINGTQGNRDLDVGKKPDTEDLHHGGRMSDINKYFEYSISLDTTNNRFISGKGAPGSGWFQYRIPLSEFRKNLHDATFSNVKYIRIWMKGANGVVKLSLVDFNLVGNQWFKPNKVDTTYNISVVSIEENSQIYMSPVAGDVLRQTVRNTSGVNTKSNEQSLAISVNNLTVGQQKLATKDYRSQVLDLFNYKVLKLFVNGDPSFNYTNEYTYDATMIVRFGSDSTNYYEYRAPIHPDIRPGQPWNHLNDVTINFAELTSLKITRDSSNQVVDLPVPNGPPGSYYRVRGSPALTSVKEFVVGVEKNRTGLNATVSGSVWFNEIRVLNVNDDNGYAYNINTGLKIADFATIGFNYSKVDPNFHALDMRSGSRNTGLNWDLSFTVNAHKLLNNALASYFSPEWKDFLNLPVSIRHTESIINPKYYPGTDIELEKAAEEKYRQTLARTNDENFAAKTRDDFIKSAQSLAIRNEISVTGVGFKFPGNNYFVRTILNAFTMNYSGSFGSQRDITYERKEDMAVTGSLTYNTDFQLADIINLKIGKFLNLGEQYKDAKIYAFFPFIGLVPAFSSNFNATTDFNRSRTESKQRLYMFDDPTSRQFRANRGFGFNWKFIENWIVDLTGTYNLRIGSDLTQLETTRDSIGRQRSNNEILKDVFFSNGLINFGRDLDYQQSSSINPKFNLPVISKFMDVNLSYNVSYAWANPISNINVGSNVGFANTVTAGGTIKFNEILGMFGVKKSMSGNQNYIRNGAASKFDDKPGLSDILKILSTFIPETISMNFNQTNAVTNPGVVGKPGFANFWVGLTQNEEYGPSRMYQLGFNRYPGKRVGNLTITDMYNLSNNITFNTRLQPIIPQSISLNLTFKKLWGFNNSGTYNTSPDGTLSAVTSLSSSKSDGYSMFFAGSADKFSFESSTDPATNVQNVTTAFKRDIASMPFPNWNLSISGLEKFPLFSEIATNVTLENAFTSEYNEHSYVDASGSEVIQSQTVTQSFNPLIGLNITFKQMFGGSMTANIRINSSTSNNLTPSSSLIQVTKTSDWSVNANYAKAGFDIPLFGLALKNDITFSLTLSKNVNEPIDYRFSTGTLEKVPGNGSTVTTFNPSISYSLSSKVQIQLFYKYIKTEPTAGNANMPPRTSNEGGLNVRVTIQ
ncbi:MAG: cell surface protein SprA [Ignavibacteria bacterium]|nr:cell surface protein SprA [Ignavibacteria bacterium]